MIFGLAMILERTATKRDVSLCDRLQARVSLMLSKARQEVYVVTAKLHFPSVPYSDTEYVDLQLLVKNKTKNKTWKHIQLFYVTKYSVIRLKAAMSH